MDIHMYFLLERESFSINNFLNNNHAGKNIAIWKIDHFILP